MHELQKPVTTLPGVGPTRAGLLAKLGVHTVGDLMELFPRDYVRRDTGVAIGDLIPDQVAAVVGTIESCQEKRTQRGRRLEATLSDGMASMVCVWFRWGRWITDKLEVGARVWVSGKVTVFRGVVQMMHPEVEVIGDSGRDKPDDFWSGRDVLPLYPLTEGITQKWLRRLVIEAFAAHHADVTENLPAQLIKLYGFTQRGAAMQKQHFPVTGTDIAQVRQRFAYEELFYHQLMLARCHHLRTEARAGMSLPVQRKFTTWLKQRLPFSLTAAQKRVIREIVADMESTAQMNRLLQGDVGSGKTIVTLFAMLIAVENGCQAALMAPTEVLAEQHFRSISRLLADQPDVRIALLKGGKSRDKTALKEAIAAGEVDIVVGTHALIQKGVVFQRLAFVAVDEQHRFGVKQRSQLADNESRPDILHLSATPIPRSLALTLWGDLDISVLDELPPGRKPIKTVWKAADRIGEVYNAVWSELQKGRQAYMVCPLVEQSEKQDLLDAETLYERLQKGPFKRYKCALLHGRMHSDEKDRVMQAFQRGEIHLLVATTVIEVGIDVANATVMVIEHAERFGLSQMHQLRGRVGRGAEESWCYLVAHPPLGEEARIRLQTMVSSTDGFVIAEKDLELRGPGNFFGTQQSGLPAFRHANIVQDHQLLKAARADALKLVEHDADMQQPDHAPVRNHYFPTYAERERLFRQ
ncbi:MAG: ATP-dependent DNA helicase RecG [Candidatus Cloacimonetes bacterium]|nr:ATP-dependent DNA helicase RecG [Candidatus Cloacimonadota bacterium]